MPSRIWAFLAFCAFVACAAKGGKKQKSTPPVKPGCEGQSILPKDVKFEPSDTVWDTRAEVLYVVSDNGQLGAQNLAGKLRKLWKFNKKLDLEGVTLIPDEPDYVYLGRELEAGILRFDVKSGKIVKEWNFHDVVSKVPIPSGKKASRAGMESLVYIPAPAGGNFRGFFLVGRQVDAVIFVLGYKDDDTISYRGFIKPPGPGADLSALSLPPDGDAVWLLYDKAKLLVSLNVTNLLHPDFDTRELVHDLTEVENYEKWNFGRAGYEGICVAVEGGQQFVVIAVDHKDGPDLVKFTEAEFHSCFAPI